MWKRLECDAVGQFGLAFGESICPTPESGFM